MNPIFATITKLDETKQTVSGRATEESIDRDGECMHYASSKPYFQQWSAEVSRDTGGKSQGNLRAMHGPVSAGILTDILFDDAERAIDIEAKITDPVEWKKLLAGNYSGFSVGGRYARKWTEARDGKMVQMFTAVPSEISIVDRPALPTARFFEIHKRDGSTIKREFQRYGSVGVDGSSLAAIRKSVGASQRIPVPVRFSDGIRVLAKASRALPIQEKAFTSQFQGNGASNTVALIKNTHRAGSRPLITKDGYAPQSSNAASGGAIANTGATNDFHDQHFGGPKASQFGTRHANSVHTRQAAPTQKVKDMMADSIKAIRKDLAMPRKQL